MVSISRIHVGRQEILPAEYRLNKIIPKKHTYLRMLLLPVLAGCFVANII